MLSVETETKLANIFLALADGEKSIDINRQILIELDDFDPYLIFTYLDSEQKNNINASDIMNYLQEKNIFPNELEIKLMIMYYDRDYDGVLSYPEFSNFLQSEYSPKRNISNDSAQKINLNINLSYNIHQALSQLLINEIEFSKKIINLLDDLKNRYDFNIHDLYHSVKNWNYIEENSLRNFFGRNKISYLESDIRKIIKRLDFNGDGKIDLCELHAFLGFPNCTFICLDNICNICGLSSCHLCISDTPCFIHNTIHRKIDINNNDNNMQEKNNKKNLTYQSEYNVENNEKDDNQEYNNNINNNINNVNEPSDDNYNDNSGENQEEEINENNIIYHGDAEEDNLY